MSQISIPGCGCKYITKITTSPYARKRAMVQLKRNRKHIVMRIQDAQVAHDVMSSDTIFAPEVTVSLVIACIESEKDIVQRCKFVFGFMVLFKVL